MAALMDVNQWPYCEGHPDCHDPHTRRYARTGTGTMRVTLSPTRDPWWGRLLCRAHALLIFGVA